MGPLLLAVLAANASPSVRFFEQRGGQCVWVSRALPSGAPVDLIKLDGSCSGVAAAWDLRGRAVVWTDTALHSIDLASHRVVDVPRPPGDEPDFDIDAEGHPLAYVLGPAQPEWRPATPPDHLDWQGKSHPVPADEWKWEGGVRLAVAQRWSAESGWKTFAVAVTHSGACDLPGTGALHGADRPSAAVPRAPRPAYDSLDAASPLAKKLDALPALKGVELPQEHAWARLKAQPWVMLEVGNDPTSLTWLLVAADGAAPKPLAGLDGSPVESVGAQWLGHWLLLTRADGRARVVDLAGRRVALRLEHAFDARLVP